VKFRLFIFSVPASIDHLTLNESPVLHEVTDCKLITEERDELAVILRSEKGMSIPFFIKLNRANEDVIPAL
jgi:hypothetical protein